MRKSIERILCHAFETDAWNRAARGIRFGGLGLRPCEHHAAGAYWASLLDSEALVRNIWPVADLQAEARSLEEQVQTWCSREVRDRFHEGE